MNMKKKYFGTEVRDLLLDLQSFLLKVGNELSSPRTLQSGLLNLSLLYSWMLVLEKDYYPQVVYSLLTDTLTGEINAEEIRKEIEKTCTELSNLIIQHKDDAVRVTLLVSRISADYDLQRTLSELLDDNPVLSVIIEYNKDRENYYNDNREVNIVDPEGEEVMQCRRFSEKAKTEIIPKLAMLATTLVDYFLTLPVQDWSEVEISTSQYLQLKGVISGLN